MDPTPSQQFDDRMAALRTKSPPGHNIFKRTTSPGQLYSLDNSRTQKVYYPIELTREDQRAEDLRRQIREKEAELAEISQSKDRLKLRIENSLNFRKATDVPSRRDYKVGKSSPLRKSVETAKNSIMRESTRKFQNEANTNYKQSTISAFRLNPATLSSVGPNDKLSHSGSGMLQPLSGGDSHYTKTLRDDNQQLQRRLNLVTAELDKITREKATIDQQLISYENETQQYQLIIEEATRDDGSERQLQAEVQRQREHNNAVQRQIQDLESQRQSVLHSLNMLRDERERKVTDSENLSIGLTEKLRVMRELEDKKVENIDRTQMLEDAIRQTDWAIADAGVGIPEMEKVYERLMKERADLIMKLENQNRQYEHTVKDFSRERAQIELTTTRNMRLMATKAMVQALSQTLRVRKQRVLNEFFTYCRFDQNCHKSLSQLATLMESCGHYTMKMHLHKWFKNCLKPIATRKQGSDLARQFYILKSKQRFFKRWQAKQHTNNLSHEQRVRSVVVIFHLIGADICKDLTAAFAKWRDLIVKERQQRRVLKLIMGRHHSKNLHQTFLRWQLFSQDVSYAIKHHLLIQQYTDSSFKFVAFSQLRECILFHKRKRQMRLAHALKAWRDSRVYSKFIMAADVAAGHIRRNQDKRLLQACWQQLRLNKATEKYTYMKEHLVERTEPQMLRLDQEIRLQANEAFQQKRTRCLTTLSKNANLKLASYFNHWSDVRDGTNERIQKNLRQVLLRYYSSSLQKGFACWKQGQLHSMITVERLKVDELTRDGNKIGKEVREKTKQVDDESARIQRNKRAALLKASFTCIRRCLEYGIRTWHQKVHRMARMEQEGAAYILLKLRKRLCKQGFEIYKTKVGLIRLMSQANNKCSHYMLTKETRRKRVVFNAICQYVTQFKGLKHNGSLLMTAMGSLLKRRALKQWQEQGNVKVQQLKNAEQNRNTHQFDHLNEKLGQRTKKHTEHLAENGLSSRGLKRQAERVLANAFARWYYVKQHRGLYRWLAAVNFEKHREHIVRRMQIYLERHIYRAVRAAWENWLASVKKEQLIKTIKQTQILTADAQTMLEYQRDQHTTLTEAHDFNIYESEHKKNLNEIKKSKIAAMLARKNDSHHNQGKFRFIFTQWRKHTARQKRFLTAINNTCQKSMWQNGFDNIAAFSRDKHLTRVQNRHLTGMMRMWRKKHTLKAFTQWRFSIWKNCVDGTVVMTKTCDEMVIQHKSKTERITDWTQLKGLRHFKRKNLLQVYSAWKQAIEEQKALNNAQKRFADQWLVLQAKRQLKRWHQRILATKRAADKDQKFFQFRDRFCKQVIFRALLHRNRQNRSLCKVLAHIAHKFDSEALEHGFKAIGYHADNRQRQNGLSKKVGAREMAYVLDFILTIKKRSHLSHLRKYCLTKKAKVMKIQSCLSHWSGMQLREAFQRWANCINKDQVAEEVNEEGPIVVKEFNWMQKLKGYNEFMEHQGYTQEERRQANNIAREKATERIARTVARLQHFACKEDDQHLKPKVFDRWVQFVQLRRVVRRILVSMGNKLAPKLADLSIAFNRWRKHRIHILSGFDRHQLAAKAGNQSRQMENIGQMVISAEEFQRQMEIQRDELIGNYMKSTRLAISLAKSNKERGMHSALNQLCDNRHSQKKGNFESILQRNIDLINQLKSRIQEFEWDNTALADENEELRQFSLDGYQIARNVSAMNEERDRLSIDLADKSRTIQQLLNTNAELSHRLKLAQENAILLINKSSHQMRAMQSHSVPPY